MDREQKQIILVSTLWDDLEKLEQLRAQICAGLKEGVVVLPDGAELTVAELPVDAPVLLVPTPPAQEEDRDMDVSLHGGRNADEKRAIQLRLQAYREAHGLGCWREASEVSGGAVSPEMLRDMATGQGVYPIADWRRAAAALTRLAQKAEEGGGGDG